MVLLLILVGICVLAIYLNERLDRDVTPICGIPASILIFVLWLVMFNYTGKIESTEIELDWYVRSGANLEIYGIEDEHLVKYERKPTAISTEYNPDLTSNQIVVEQREHETIMKVLFFVPDKVNITMIFNNKEDYKIYQEEYS